MGEMFRRSSSAVATAEQATASKDQAGKSSTDDGAGNGSSR